jgi:hypothetical protein
MKTRIEIEEVVTNSGIFKVNEHGCPEAVFQTSFVDHTVMGTETLKNVHVRYFFDAVCETLLKYYNRPSSLFSIDEEIQELQRRITQTLAEYVPDSKAQQYAKLITEDRNFRLDIRTQLEATGVFKKPKKGERRYYHLLLPLYQIFHKYLDMERETYFYVTHFLIGCNMERGKFTAVYERNRKFVERFENKIGTASASAFRKNPKSIIDIP